MTTTTLPRPTGDLRWRTADQTHLAMPKRAEEDEATERERAIRAVHRIAGNDADDLLDQLGLLPPKEVLEPTGKCCSTCQKEKSFAEFYKRLGARDGLSSQCKACVTAARKRRVKPSRAKKTEPTNLVECSHCRMVAEHEAHGWCHACYLLWTRAGRPDGGPPPRRNGRYEEYRALTRDQHCTRREAAERMGISYRTAERYETRIGTQTLAVEQHKQAVA